MRVVHRHLHRAAHVHARVHGIDPDHGHLVAHPVGHDHEGQLVVGGVHDVEHDHVHHHFFRAHGVSRGVDVLIGNGVGARLGSP